MAKIRYNVKGVPRRPPFPLKDPAVDGIRRSGRNARKRKELPPEFEQFRLYDVEGLGDFPPVEWYIDGYLAVGELTVLYGKGDTFKSFVALAWACQLAHEGHVVIYVVSEGASGIKARVAAWQKHHGVERLPTLRLMPSNVNLHRPGEVETWTEAMRFQLGEDVRPALVVVDTLARNFVGGSENSPQDMGMFVEGVERIRRGLETAVLVLHHSTKDDKSERGTESLRNASFAVFRFDRRNQRVVDVSCERMKDAEPPVARRVVPTKIDLPELGDGVSSLVADWVAFPGDGRRETRRERRRELTRRERELLQLLRDGKCDGKPAKLAAALKVSSSTVERTAKSLLNAGFLSSEGTTRDRRYTLTTAAVEAIG